jgi:hypothetical protein
MNKFYLLAILCCSVSFSIETLKFECQENVYFDSAKPLFTDSELGSLPILSEHTVCGISASFSGTCRANLIHQGNEYNYSWRCDDAFGDLYFTSEHGGFAEFRCSGEKVSAKLENRTYQGCKLGQ